MNRRELLQTALPATAAVTLSPLASTASGEVGAASAYDRELYEWRTYHLADKSKQQSLHRYFETACIPAWQNMGLGPVGAFTEIGPNAGPSIHLLLVYATPESLVTSREALERDPKYKSAAADHLAAKKDDPAFDRISSWLMLAFASYPVITPPAKKPRVFEVRTYKNHGEDRARAKIDMFNDGEINIFPKCGFQNVFFGEVLAGTGLPCLKYMLAAPDMAANEASWKTFIAHPDFVRMREDPKYANTQPEITKLFLEPTDYSQI